MQLQKLAITGLAVMAGLVIQGCSDPDANISRETAQQFWNASVENKTQNLARLLEDDDPSSRFWMAGVRAGDQFEVGSGQLNEETGLWEVPTSLAQPCRSDIAFNTLVRVEQETGRINGTGTLRNLMLAWQTPPTEIKTYCYPVADQPMTGEFFGRPWRASEFQAQSLPGSDGARSVRRVTGHWCQQADAQSCEQSAALELVLKLDLEGAEQGRNLSASDRVIVQSEGKPDVVLREGSYQLDRSAPTARLGLRASTDDLVINGYIMVPRAALEKWSGRN